MFGQKENQCLFIAGRDEYDPIVAAEDAKRLVEGVDVYHWIEERDCGDGLVKNLVVFNYRKNPILFYASLRENGYIIEVNHEYVEAQSKRVVHFGNSTTKLLEFPEPRYEDWEDVIKSFNVPLP